MFKLLKELIFGNPKLKELKKPAEKLTHSLSNNVNLIKKIFHNDDTIVYREFETCDQIQCCVIFAEGMVNKDVLNRNVLKRVMACKIPEGTPKKNLIDLFVRKIVTSEEVKRVSCLDEFIDQILYGDALLLINGYAVGLLIGAKGWVMRSIESPQSENVVRGPREGFIESLTVNISLIRRKIKDSDLKFQLREMGTRTKTRVAVCYIEGLANEKIIQELWERLEQIDIDGILESGYIEELIRDSPLSPFKTIGHTERPDVAAAKLLEGRIIVLCDGTPFVLTLPYIFMENFQANEDYYKNTSIASVDRMMRYAAYFLTTSTPAIYVALVTFHQEMIPTPLLFSISASREGVPFPTIFEAIALGFIFELLREGGVRLPTPIGQAVSIVGAIILGDAAVTAKLVSAPMIIVTALTGISSFLVPQAIESVLVVRLLLIILAAFFGLYGYIFGIIGFIIQLMSMRSFGVPYMSSMGSLNLQDLKDTMIRAPWWYMHLRPKIIGKQNRERQPYQKLGRERDELGNK